ncbi:hypothetical protein G7Y89_g11477 [Cudoniella acicularis]|uniref:Zn(2)-C6 fungal-type domain-containing protein n=1 Tax=Cudoniella acicularis TaxID=354080 RepID=A0A8H4REF6_9HELO|nr:hypothetical protein G7Y89_g11477 [Cudoniella acicularis]
MSSVASNEPTGEFSGEPPRKRVRKGTKSCWECKRRKIRCQLSSEDVPVCSGCLARGTTCLSQEYPEEREPSSNTQIGERLGRVERLLEKLIDKISAYEEDERAQKDMLTPESLGGDVLTPYASNTGSGTQDTTPFMSLFDNSVIGRRETIPSQGSTPVTHPIRTKTPSCRVPKLERVRQTLVDLLPTQRDADLIVQHSNCSLLIHIMLQHAADPSGGESESDHIASVFHLEEVAKKHPVEIARTILYLAVCLQQLNPSFDRSKLSLLPTIEARIDRYLSTVQALITSDDELVSSMEGLECLTLQGMYHVNAGSPKRAWLTFRRALNVGQFMGIDRKTTELPGGRIMWFQIVHADRYLALLLGLPVGSKDDPFEPGETFQNPDIDKDMLFGRKLCVLSGRIMDRNQAENSHAYATTQDIDEKLEQLSREMPASWWEIPTYFADDRSKEAKLQFDRLMVQIWYFQLESLLHLPFMLRAATERRYDYSKFSCLKASRQMMYRYLAMQGAANKAFCCKVVDFGALTATITLLLGLLEPPNISQTYETRDQRETDRGLINAMLKSLEEMSQGGKDVIATQSINVINSLLSVDTPSGRAAGNLRLTIPYFGTISIIRPATSSSNPLPNQNTQSITVDHSVMHAQASEASASWPNAPSLQTPDPNFPMKKAMDQNLDETALRNLEEELHTEIYPGTEIMRDVGTHHFVKASAGAHSVLVPQPSDNEHDPLAPMFGDYIEAFDSDLEKVVQFTGVAILVLGFSNFIWLNGIGAGPAETAQSAITSDVIFLHDRGKFQTLYFAFYFGSLMVGPIISGPMAQRYGWRSFWWFNTAVLGFTVICCIFLFPETKFNRAFAPTHSVVSSTPPLNKGSAERVEISEGDVQTPQANNERNPVNPENSASAEKQSRQQGDDTLTHVHTHQDPWLGRGKPSKAQWKLFQPYEGNFLLELWLPWKLFLFPIVEFAAFVVSWSASSFLTLNLTQSQVFAAPPYNFTPQKIGLFNFAILIGGFLGLITAGPLSDAIAARLTKRNKGIREPEMRLLAMIPYVIIMVIGNVVVALGYQNSWDWKVIVIIGYTCAGIQVAALPAISSTYAIDSYKPVTGAIFVNITVNKNVWGYGFSKFITPWTVKSGYIPPIMTNMSLVLLWCLTGIIFWFYGKTFRKWSRNDKVHKSNKFCFMMVLKIPFLDAY